MLILMVGKKVDFFFSGFSKAQRIVLSGSFNNRDPNAIPLERYRDGWLCLIELPPGKHFYKFIIDGKWITDPTNHLLQKDQKGNLNSILIVH